MLNGVARQCSKWGICRINTEYFNHNFINATDTKCLILSSVLKKARLF